MLRWEEWTVELNDAEADIVPELASSKENDVFLMQVFAQQGYRNSKLHTLNRCRQHLQVITLGDITDAGGTIILPPIKKGQIMSTSTSIYQWPRQPDPGPQAWRLWRQALRKSFEFRDMVVVSFRSAAWSTTSSRIHHWRYDRTHDCLFHRLPQDKW